MKADVLQDLSVLTTTPKVSFSTLTDKAIECIAQTVYSGKLIDETEYQFNIGLGTLELTIDGEDLHFRFVPIESLTEKIESALDGEKIIVKELEEKVAQRLLRTYKDI